MKIIRSGLFTIVIIQLAFSCGYKASDGDNETEVKPRTPVTVTTIEYSPIQEFIELNATSAYLQKSYIKANLTGYIKSANIHFGSFVNSGQTLFSLKT